EYFGANEEFGKEFFEFEDWKNTDFSKFEDEIIHLRRLRVFKEIMNSYDSLKLQVRSLEVAKEKLSSYKPGAWKEEVGYMKIDDYDVPKTVTLLLIGAKGSGKSSLVNRILRVFEGDKITSGRAQVTYNSCDEDGTLYLHEYMIPKDSTSFCLYDTRGLFEDSYDNNEMIKRWMTEGVRHGELVLRASDAPNEEDKARQTGCSKEARMVNFVIFVVDALLVLKSMAGEDDTHYKSLLQSTWRFPYLSYRDDKPVVVCTHGDLLSDADRTRVRIHLGELLGIHPAKQIFDISEKCDPETDLAVVDMLTYSLLHADKHLPVKKRPLKKVLQVLGILILSLVFLFFFAFGALTILRNSKACEAIWPCCPYQNNSSGIPVNHVIPSSESGQGIDIDWHKIRHLWFGGEV
ncbi:P-loop containing nucleoside triphosphate hydrolases superfamily protein, partial [Thalictrum thalictroides]